MTNVNTDKPMSILDFGGYEGKFVMPTDVAIVLFKALTATNVYRYKSEYKSGSYQPMLNDVEPGSISLTNISAGQVLQGRINAEDEEKLKSTT